MSLSMTPHSLSIKKTLSRHKTYKILTSQETSLYAFRKGSMTAEAAVVIPLVAFFLVGILFFMRMIQIQFIVEQAMFYAGRKTAVESSVTGSDAFLFFSAEMYFLQILEEYECIDAYVENGSLGISLLNSNFSGDDIILRAEYSMKLPISIFGIERFDFWQEHIFKKWTGDAGVIQGDYVYVSKSGEVYHCSTRCRSIEVSVKQALYEKIDEIRGSDGQKYYPCSKCIKDIQEKDKVYYTEYGTLFHGNISCNALKRTVTKIPISDVGDRRKCKFCYGE